MAVGPEGVEVGMGVDRPADVGVVPLASGGELLDLLPRLALGRCWSTWRLRRPGCTAAGRFRSGR